MIEVIDWKYARAYIKCNCGHYARDHFSNEGWCSGKCPEFNNATCGCTWYYPNDKWLAKQRIKANLEQAI